MSDENKSKIRFFDKFKKKGKRKKKRKKKFKIFETFTKLWVTILLFIAVIDLQLSYILAYLGRTEIAETLSVAIVTEIIGVISVYMIRAFFDTASEKKLDYDFKRNGLRSLDDTPVGVEDDESDSDETIEGVG